MGKGRSPGTEVGETWFRSARSRAQEEAKGFRQGNSQCEGQEQEHLIHSLALPRQSSLRPLLVL
jgi:hypothetical protein